MAAGPLNGIRVLDFTHVWAGPLGTRILGDLGAEIIKVEAPLARGPAALPAGTPVVASVYGDDHWNRQGVTNKLNRNKLGLCIDGKSDQGREVLIDLIRHSDIVVENFSANAMSDLGLGWDDMRLVNPSIIYVAMPGFGHSGPHRDFVAYGTIVEPMCGLTSFMGYSADEPRVTATATPDACAGTTLAATVVTALHRRDKEGIGGYIELALQEAAIVFLGEYFLMAQIDAPPSCSGNGHADYSPHGIYRCAGDDHWIAIATQNESEWQALSTNAGLGWASDGRFTTLEDRIKNRLALDEIIQSWTLGFDKTELMVQLQNVGVPAGAVQVTEEFLTDPQSLNRRFFTELGGDHIDTKLYPGLPMRTNGVRGENWRPAPKLGEHNHKILSELLDMDDASIKALEESGILRTSPPE
ncbi:MAG TPA: CoA transferase [Arenicellales bacterium]|jgi:crotonobetainyl-CoA:carnitine CoA-transferase CaiB-like acyl-CoA transferase|nr:hypothetical protein [Gammaproteobacteria bacterium]MDP6026199.1 CoA transferase [Pseudomonadales bacterium]HJL52268.1 CoA transferase [Arenicellales bacterium]MDP6314936.1 CoA transferase [Pseudomonadales bacterium]MDP7314814.1 CoA transferase [Pseudomonadales bacterium]|tara:strand:- start:52 stop:1290 length:1239 start_codon:yes stop_codon:yes gene_type:complete